LADIGMKKIVKASYDEALARIPELLKAEGFGVLTRIDVKQTLKEKIGVDFRRYQILGACNPRYAHEALKIELDLGVMLPCNVIVYEGDDGRTVVTAVDPLQTIAASDPSLRPVADQVRQKLASVLAKLE
jgi:uncharacterized protein (DUF302 family)